jgi:hypothetical protein
MKQAGISDVFDRVFKSVCTSNVVVSLDSLIPGISSDVKTPTNAKEDLDDPEPADERDIQTYFCG